MFAGHTPSRPRNLAAGCPSLEGQEASNSKELDISVLEESANKSSLFSRNKFSISFDVSKDGSSKSFDDSCEVNKSCGSAAAMMAVAKMK